MIQPAAPKYTGLTHAEIHQSREKHGWNLLTPPVQKSAWKLLLEKFDDPVIRILLLAAVTASMIGDWIEGLGILFAVFLAAGLAFLNEYKAAKAFEILNQVTDITPLKAVRDSKFILIPKKEAVVGDILFIEQGEELAADGTVLEAVNLQVDQSKLTGESDPAVKSPKGTPLPHEEEAGAYPHHHLLRGTLITEGYGFMEISAVGDATEIGKTARSASEETHELTPLNLQLQSLSQWIGIIGFTGAGATFLALIIRAALTGKIVQSYGQWAVFSLLLLTLLIWGCRIWLPVFYDGLKSFCKIRSPAWLEKSGIWGWLAVGGVGMAVALGGLLSLWMTGNLPYGNEPWLSPEAIPQFVLFFMIAVTLIVVTVPEGLAMSVTLSLAYSMRKMTAQNNLVRKMHACETIGAVTVICSDKTGTLTLNRMTVQSVNSDGIPDPSADTLPARQLRELFAANATANLSFADDTPSPIGNPTECALLLWLHAQQNDYQSLRSAFTQQQQWTFSTERKMMGTQGLSAVTGETVLYIKGAPEIILHRCSAEITSTGVKPLSDERRKTLLAELKNFQQRGMRTLGFAFKSDAADHTGKDLNEVASELVWLAFAAIADPVRPDVPQAVKSCQKAGIQIKMVTGDNAETAREIARQAGLWDGASGDAVITGPEFAALGEEAALEAAKRIAVMARARPDDKLRLVRLLKSIHHVVAVTGDGTNDAPALNYADVGISMGKTGTSAAKEASDIILLDDAFTSIETAVMWGRSLYQNIRRFIVFQLIINVTALSLAISGPFIGIELPLTVMQMLWVNLIMDTFAALALATEPARLSVMSDLPRRKTDFIISKPMMIQILGTGALFVAFFIGMILWMKHDGDFSPKELTVFFSIFVFLQFWNLFNARAMGAMQSAFSGLKNNPAFALIAAAIAVGQILIVQFGGRFFRTVPLSAQEWAIIITATSAVLWFGEGYRFLLRTFKKSGGSHES